MAIRKTKGRDCPLRQSHELPVAASTAIEQGKMVGLNASGYVVEMSGTTGLTALGIAIESADNSSGANGDINCKFMTGRFLLDNDGSNTCVITDKGGVCYAEDDETVGNVATGLSVAGRIYDVTSEGVWVDFVYPNVAVDTDT